MKLYFKYRVACSLLRYGLSTLCRLSVVTPLALLLFFSSDAFASLSGQATLTYKTYDGSAENGIIPGQRRSLSSSSLKQNYSLLYSTSGRIYNSRVGSYQVSLGYDWTVIDSTFKSSSNSSKDFKQSRGHFKYLGEVKINPKEIPFRLDVHSRDMNRTVTTYSGGGNVDNFGSLIGGFEQPSFIIGGLRIETGATLLAGVKNGMTNGYNEILRHFPMLLIDFRDSINRDRNPLYAVDTQLTRLAFVSLNKKDNWFHYRHLRFRDNLNSSNNYEEDQIQLGSVDQNLQRRWIDFSNWIKVSTDMQFTKHKTAGRQNPTEETELNMFVTAERSKWSAQTYSWFNRFVAEDKAISYQSSLPLYINGSVDRDLSWSSRTSFRNNQDTDNLGKKNNYTAMLAGYSINAFKNSPFNLNQSIDVESTVANASNSLTISANIGANSTSRFSRTVALGSFYRISHLAHSSSDGSSSESLFHNLLLNGRYSPTKTLMIQFSQRNIFTQGKSAVAEDVPFNSYSQLSYNNGQGSLSMDETGSESYQSFTDLTASWVPKPRLNVSFALNEVIQKSSLLPITEQTRFSSHIDFSSASWSVRNSLAYALDNTNSSSVSESASLSYTFRRGLNASVGSSYSASKSNVGRTNAASFSQSLNYSYFTTNGATRVLFDINESMSKSVSSPKSSITNGNFFTLGLRYYPIRRLTLAGGTQYSSDASMSNYSLVWYASASANFRLLQASVDYTSGFRAADKLRENKLTGNILKSF